MFPRPLSLNAMRVTTSSGGESTTITVITPDDRKRTAQRQGGSAESERRKMPLGGVAEPQPQRAMTSVSTATFVAGDSQLSTPTPISERSTATTQEADSTSTRTFCSLGKATTQARTIELEEPTTTLGSAVAWHIRLRCEPPPMEQRSSDLVARFWFQFRTKLDLDFAADLSRAVDRGRVAGCAAADLLDTNGWSTIDQSFPTLEYHHVEWSNGNARLACALSSAMAPRLYEGFASLAIPLKNNWLDDWVELAGLRPDGLSLTLASDQHLFHVLMRSVLRETRCCVGIQEGAKPHTSGPLRFPIVIFDPLTDRMDASANFRLQLRPLLGQREIVDPWASEWWAPYGSLVHSHSGDVMGLRKDRVALETVAPGYLKWSALVTASRATTPLVELPSAVGSPLTKVVCFGTLDVQAAARRDAVPLVLGGSRSWFHPPVMPELPPLSLIHI